MAQAQLRVTEWNADKLLARSTQILEEFAPVIAEEARRQIKSPVWNWPNPTVRFRSLFQGGETIRSRYGTGVLIPKGKRDIVDTGFLLSSQQSPQVSDNTLSIQWTAPYAAQVLRGSYPNPYYSPLTRRLVGPVGDKPPRNWIQAAHQAQPFLPFFMGRWKALSGS